ncbi:MAG: DUF1837 domain-containing protein [Intestinimonas butyriciproducens]|uniref:HamA C-terminal domain-containing protein n=1 Tax=Intestinimonas butyriciproducens TaxID=1297617 RepID=UPI00399465AC|nr:DUF1837 domain-containing protein [Clostridiales bacterium]
MNKRVFDTQNIILLKVDETDLNSFLVDMDLDDSGQYVFQLESLANAIIETIPEYVFADYKGSSLPLAGSVSRLREAAKSIYKIKEYELMYRAYVLNDAAAMEKIEKSSYMNRGEFGELLLHLLLRDVKGTIPLISKVYFKDSPSVPAHGFDAVHITPENKILWLGESKFYSDAEQGLNALLNDLNEHFKRDYLNEQFVIIKKNLENNSIPQREEWLERLTNCTRLSDELSMINIPLLCMYPHDIYKKFSNMNDMSAVLYHEANVRELKAYFDSHNKHPLKTSLNIILLLFPIESKKELVTRLHEKLWHMQNM